MWYFLALLALMVVSLALTELCAPRPPAQGGGTHLDKRNEPPPLSVGPSAARSGRPLDAP